jgi:hypothetical protein
VGKAGICTFIREVKKVITDPEDKKGFTILVLDEAPEQPKVHRFWQAHGNVKGMEWLLTSLTDDQVFSWFKVKEHKPKKKKAQ